MNPLPDEAAKLPVRSVYQLSAIGGVLATLRLIAGRRVRFPRGHVGGLVTLPDGRTYRIFREVVIDPRPGQPDVPGAIFIPRFHVRGMSPRRNIAFSWLPAMLIIGLPGLRSKRWLIHDETGDFAGLYEWDTVADAKRYESSSAMDFMRNRSFPASVSSRVLRRDEWTGLGAALAAAPAGRHHVGSRR